MNRIYDVIVVGGGPAGIAATVYSAYRQLNVLLLSPDLGGRTNQHLELADRQTPYVARGADIAQKLLSELDSLSHSYHPQQVAAITRDGSDFRLQLADRTELQARSIIYATGVQPRRLGLPDEETYYGRGLAYSAITYVPMFRNRVAVVVGDGKRAWRAVAELARVTAAVHLVTVVPRLPDTPEIYRLRQATNVVIWQGHKVQDILGSEFAKRVVLVSPQGDETVIQTDGVFVELELMPIIAPVRDLVQLDEERRIRVDSVNRSSCPGFFAAGDVTNVYAEHVLVAVGEGIKAALSASEYLLLA